jgi:CheY-like chemotaxis protein
MNMNSTSGNTGGELPENRSPRSGTSSKDGPASMLHKLLLVEDESDGAELAATLLSANGLEVVLAHSADEALRILQDDKDIDAMFTDIMMPGMNGLELADAVSNMYPTVKIVLTSGYVVPELLKNRERPYLFAAKPYRIDDILQMLRS